MHHENIVNLASEEPVEFTCLKSLISFCPATITIAHFLTIYTFLHFMATRY